MLHNRRAWNYRSHATHRSCHKHWHSYQCIKQRSRLVEQLAHHRLYDTKIQIATHIWERYKHYTQKGSQTLITSSGSEVALSNTTWSKYGLRGLQIHNPSQLVPRSQAATWEPRTTRRRPRRNHLCARCRPPLKQVIEAAKRDWVWRTHKFVGRYRPNDDGGSKAVL